MTALQAAKERLEAYVVALATHSMTSLDLLKLQSMENEIVLASQRVGEPPPF